MKNFPGNAVCTQMRAVATVTADGNSSAIDILDYDSNMLITLDCNAGTGTGRSLAIKIQSSDDNVTFTDVPGGAFTTVTLSASFQTKVINAAEVGRYVRLNFDISGTTPSYYVSATLIGPKKSF